MSFFWGGVSGGQAPAMLIKTVSQKVCPVVEMRILDSRIQLLLVLFGGAMDIVSFFLLFVTPQR